MFNIGDKVVYKRDRILSTQLPLFSCEDGIWGIVDDVFIVPGGRVVVNVAWNTGEYGPCNVKLLRLFP
jgi:hypothetical protein